MKSKNLINSKIYLLLIILALGISFIIYKHNYELGILSNLILILLFISILIIIIFNIKNIEDIDHIPLYALSTFYILICYLGLFLFDKYKIFPRFNVNDYEFALKILSFSFIFYSLGYLIVKLIGKKFLRKEIKSLEATTGEIFSLGVICLVGSIFFYYFIYIQNYLSFLAQVKYPILLFGSGLLITFIALEKNKKFIFYKLFSIFLIIIPIFLEIISGAFSFPFMVIFLFFIFYCLIKKKIFISPFIILFTIFLLFHVGKYDLRKNFLLMKNDSNSNLSIFYNTYNKIFSESSKFNKVFKCIKLSDKNVASFSEEKIDCILTRDLRLERRIFHSIESLLIVTTSSPDKIPFWNGYSYKILSSKLIPRIFWKEKPSDTLGNEFGRRYNVLTKKDEKLGYNDDLITSWNMPVINEFYVNFGILGSIFGSLFLGLLIGFIEKLSVLKNNYNLEKILLFFIFAPLFLMESHLSLLLGALLQSYIFLVGSSLLFLFLKRKLIK